MKYKNILFLLLTTVILSSCSNSGSLAEKKWKSFWETFQTAVVDDDIKTIKSLCFWNEQFTEAEFDKGVNDFISEELKAFVLTTNAENFEPEAKQPFEIIDFTNDNTLVFKVYRELKYNITIGEETKVCSAFLGMRNGNFYISMWYSEK